MIEEGFYRFAVIAHITAFVDENDPEKRYAISNVITEALPDPDFTDPNWTDENGIPSREGLGAQINGFAIAGANVVNIMRNLYPDIDLENVMDIFCRDFRKICKLKADVELLSSTENREGFGSAYKDN